MNLMNILLYVVVWGIVFYVLWWGLGKLGLPEPFNKIAIAVLVLLSIVVILNIFGIVNVGLPSARIR